MKGNAKVVVRANRDNQQRISVIMSLPTLASLPFKKAQTAIADGLLVIRPPSVRHISVAGAILKR